MVRLRSERWFSADGQRRSRRMVSAETSGTRRLLSLCLLLVLVIILMQKAADPKYVRNAFSSLGVPLEQQTSEVAGKPPPAVPTGELGRTAQSDHSLWSVTCQDLVPRLLGGATNAQVHRLSDLWFALDRDAPRDHPANLSELQAETFEILTGVADGLQPAIGSGQQSDWHEQLARFDTQWHAFWDRLEIEQSLSPDSNVPVAEAEFQRAPDAGNPVELTPEFESAMTRFLDQRLLASLRDASPWTHSEAVPFRRLLQRGQGTGRVSTAPVGVTDGLNPLISTLQLESEAEVYRGRTVRYRGSVRRVQRGDQALGLARAYWRLWLRGTDDAVQPVAVYTSDEVAERFAQILTDSEAAFPEIEVRGVVAKRLAYGSASGVQVAPTLFADSIEILPPDQPVVTNMATGELLGRLGWAALAGGLLAAVVLIPIIAGRRRRTIRRRLPKFHQRSSLLLLCGSLAAYSCGDTLAAAQSTGDQASPAVVQPPWARATGDDPQQVILAERLRGAFSPAATDELRQYVAAAQVARFPDAALKAIHTLSQVGWQRMLSSDVSFELEPSALAVRRAELAGLVRLAMPIALSDDQMAWFQREPDEQIYRMEVELRPELFGSLPPAPDDESPVPDDGDKVRQASDELNRAESRQTVETKEPAAELLTVFCRSVPDSWLSSVRLRQPVKIDGLALIESGGTVADSLCVFAEMPTWVLPEDIAPDELAPPLASHLMDLGQRGWNLSWLDLVSKHNQKPLRRDESDPYYTMLRIAANETFSSDAAGARQATTEPMAVLAEPHESVGKWVRWRVRLVSGSVVEVTDPRAQATLDADRYFQFDGFVDIGRQRVRYQVSGSEGHNETVDFEGEFPVTIVMRDDCGFVPSDALASGQLSWEVGRYALVTGRHYRLWSYQSELMQSKNEAARQTAPLVVGSSLEITSPPPRQTPAIGWFGYALCGATLAFLSAILVLVLKKETPRRRT